MGAATRSITTATGSGASEGGGLEAEADMADGAVDIAGQSSAVLAIRCGRRELVMDIEAIYC
ncbi:MAG: hypothetical protein AMXMBFR78_02690 [Rubrivivax sp.]